MDDEIIPPFDARRERSYSDQDLAWSGRASPEKEFSKNSDRPLSSSILCRQLQKRGRWEDSAHDVDTAQQLPYSPRDARFRLDQRVGLPHSDIIEATLTDMYQVTMAYAYWKAGKDKDQAVFDVFFRKCPFKGEFAVAAGIEEVIRFINGYKFCEPNIQYLKKIIPHAEDEFWDFMRNIDCSQVKVYSVEEGAIVFPKVPVMRVEGPLIICQLLETTILNLLNYPTLVATNGARHVIAAGKDKQILEFGTRRAQGPDGAMSASRYSYLGGLTGTANVKAAQAFDIPCSGTHAHAYVTSFNDFKELPTRSLGKEPDFVGKVLAWREKLGYTTGTESELVAFTSYAQAFPNACLCLIDTYDTLLSGVPNFMAVAIALHECGFTARGIRLDSGDLAYLSNQVRKMFDQTAEKFNLPWMKDLKIVASNDIDENVLLSLKEQGHAIDVFGIGTNLVTCKAQPALGMVYKLVELNGEPRIKISNDVEKTTIPGRKDVYRLFSSDGHPLLDLMQQTSQPAPQVGQSIFCRHPFDNTKRCEVIATTVEPLLKLTWNMGKLELKKLPTLKEARQKCMDGIEALRGDHIRPTNPTPYKVSITKEFHDFFENIFSEKLPIKTLR